MSAQHLRTHDKTIYLEENRYETPKEIFVNMVELARRGGGLKPGARVGDFGCAAGEFLYYLRKQEPAAVLQGYDVVPELLEKARQHVPGVSFSQGSVLDPALVPEGSMDVSFMLGVASIFDDFRPILDNLIRWTKKGGRIYMFGCFNPHPVDVWVTYRSVHQHGPDHREVGWNMFSMASVSQYLDAKLGTKCHKFSHFELSFDLDPTPGDPARTWTFKTEDGRRAFTNGLSLIVNREFLEIIV
ncbi:MAG TPA: class I SAM-dependent methyltransferase [Burkholderiales bacterium]|nr:class I SAM-dependent methyltransferase [Burkholderiales bacterium]